MPQLPEITFGWLKTIGQLTATCHVCFHHSQSGLAVALDLLSTHSDGGPVLDADGTYVGYVNVFDVMRAVDRGVNLLEVQAKDIMRRDLAPVTESTPIAEAVKLMNAHHVVSLPVERGGKVAYSVRCHDLLRARIALREDHEHGFSIPHAAAPHHEEE